MVGNLSKTMLV